MLPGRGSPGSGKGGGRAAPAPACRHCKKSACGCPKKWKLHGKPKKKSGAEAAQGMGEDQIAAKKAKFAAKKARREAAKAGGASATPAAAGAAAEPAETRSTAAPAEQPPKPARKAVPKKAAPTPGAGEGGGDSKKRKVGPGPEARVDDWSRKSSHEPKPKKQLKKMDEYSDSWRGPRLRYKKDANGTDLCHNFNRGHCKDRKTKRGLECQMAHACDNCQGDHPASECTEPSDDDASAPKRLPAKRARGEPVPAVVSLIAVAAAKAGGATKLATLFAPANPSATKLAAFFGDDIDDDDDDATESSSSSEEEESEEEDEESSSEEEEEEEDEEEEDDAEEEESSSEEEEVAKPAAKKAKVASIPVAPVKPVQKAPATPAAKIKELKELLDMGAVTQEEFDQNKAVLIKQLLSQ